MRRNLTVLISSATLCLLFSCVALNSFLGPNAETKAQERSSALARWESRTFVKYRMILANEQCTTDYEVVAERVAWGYETPCGRGQTRSVTNLFALIAPDQAICIGATCSCKRVTSLQVYYNTTLGYPQQITIRTKIWPNWQSASFWNTIASNLANPCSGDDKRIFRVLSLIPHN